MRSNIRPCCLTLLAGYSIGSRLLLRPICPSEATCSEYVRAARSVCRVALNGPSL